MFRSSDYLILYSRVRDNSRVRGLTPTAIKLSMFCVPCWSCRWRNISLIPDVVKGSSTLKSVFSLLNAPLVQLYLLVQLLYSKSVRIISDKRHQQWFQLCDFSEPGWTACWNVLSVPDLTTRRRTGHFENNILRGALHAFLPSHSNHRPLKMRCVSQSSAH